MSANLKSLLRPRITAFLMASLAVVALSGCATAPADPAARAEFEAENDPLEPMNRAVFAFNVQMDKMFLKPAGIVYRETLPQPVRTGVGNFLSNLRSPVVLANDLLQGEMDR
ncbi:MAG: MlaA family lipoprotein, partial [Alphaproteobacteria bacterium]